MPIRILIADDHAVFRSGLRALLEKEEDFQVIGETGTGTETMRRVAKGNVDVLLLDINMPDINGLELVSFVKNNEKYASIPLVIVSTEGSERDREKGLGLGADAYLVKPFQKSDLVPAIEVAIGRFKELRNLTGELDALGEQLEARKTIDRAKGLLIDECGMREQEAFSFIQRTAMSERTKMRDVADRIIDGSLRP